jgi:hypothetical protein
MAVSSADPVGSFLGRTYAWRKLLTLMLINGWSASLKVE